MSSAAAASDQIDKGARIIAAIGNEIATGLELLDQDWCDGLVGNLALRQHFAKQLDCYDTDRMIERYRGIASRLVIYLASHWREVDPKVLERWGEVARAVRKAG